MSLLYQYAATKARISFLGQEIAAGLEVREWTAGHLQKMEDYLEEWQLLDSEGASLRRQILHYRFTKSMRESFQQAANWQDRDVVRIQSTLEMLAEYDAALAARLEQEFRDRLQERNNNNRK